MNKTPILIVRGCHPAETSAYILAHKVYTKLAKEHDVKLATIPFKNTMFGKSLARHPVPKDSLPRVFLDQIGIPQDQYYFDFHNYISKNLNENPNIIHDPEFGAVYSKAILFRTDFYGPKQLSNAWLPRFNKGDMGIVTGMTIEIPAIFKKMPEQLLKRLSDYVHPKQEYGQSIVDIKETRKQKGLSETYENLLATLILNFSDEKVHGVKSDESPDLF